MSVVFMVSRGEYSDYVIEGVFSTREAAEAYLRAVDAWVGRRDPVADPYDSESRYGYKSEAHIEEVEVDSYSRGPRALAESVHRAVCE